jgi:hypothetical protein
MLHFVFDFALGILGRALGKMTEPAPLPRPPRPDPMRVEATATAYRTWAAERRFVRDDAERAYRGTLCRRDVLVAPGLDGGAPVSVEAKIAMSVAADDGGARTALLLRPSDEGSTAIEKALCALFHDPDFSAALRSIALAPNIVRLRFAPLTAPRLVERAVAGAIEAIESCQSGGYGAPYR